LGYVPWPGGVSVVQRWPLVRWQSLLPTGSRQRLQQGSRPTLTGPAQPGAKPGWSVTRSECTNLTRLRPAPDEAEALARDGDADRGAARPETLEDRPVRTGRPAVARRSPCDDPQDREMRRSTRNPPGCSHRHAVSARPAASLDGRRITASRTASARSCAAGRDTGAIMRPTSSTRRAGPIGRQAASRRTAPARARRDPPPGGTNPPPAFYAGRCGPGRAGKQAGRPCRRAGTGPDNQR
jgi:hypothetical protein